ncbi:MAG: hypothetical protein ACYTF0_01535 [Planctomycetota bacterium]|jgi:hypothetical protein
MPSLITALLLAMLVGVGLPAVEVHGIRIASPPSWIADTPPPVGHVAVWRLDQRAIVISHEPITMPIDAWLATTAADLTALTGSSLVHAQAVRRINGHSWHGLTYPIADHHQAIWASDSNNQRVVITVSGPDQHSLIDIADLVSQR